MQHKRIGCRIKSSRYGAGITLFLSLSWAAASRGQPFDRGHQILLADGLQIQALVSDLLDCDPLTATTPNAPCEVSGRDHDTVFDLDTWKRSNFTTLNFGWIANPERLLNDRGWSDAKWARSLDIDRHGTKSYSSHKNNARLPWMWPDFKLSPREWVDYGENLVSLQYYDDDGQAFDLTKPGNVQRASEQFAIWRGDVRPPEYLEHHSDFVQKTALNNTTPDDGCFTHSSIDSAYQLCPTTAPSDWQSYQENYEGYTDTILYTVQGGWSYEPSTLRAYMSSVKPDMLMFDSYQFGDEAWDGGSPTRLYEHMQKYRSLGLGGHDGGFVQPIPYAQYIQMFRIPGGSDSIEYRVGDHTLSESEMRLQYFGSWAFGYKFLTAMYYNSDNCLSCQRIKESILFEGLGDDYPTALFNQVADTNRQSRNLGDSLVRLLSLRTGLVPCTLGVGPIELCDNGVWMVPGEHLDEGGIVIGNARPTGIPAWRSGVDPYITSVSASNDLCEENVCKNNGLPGDLLIGYFNVLDESLDGPHFDGETYFMIVNGLTDADGSATETVQTVTVDFDFLDSGVNTLLRLNRNTGLVDEVPLNHRGGSKYHYEFALEGGTGDLFNFGTGAPFTALYEQPARVYDLCGDMPECDGFIRWELVDLRQLELHGNSPGPMDEPIPFWASLNSNDIELFTSYKIPEVTPPFPSERIDLLVITAENDHDATFPEGIETGSSVRVSLAFEAGAVIGVEDLPAESFLIGTVELLGPTGLPLSKSQKVIYSIVPEPPAAVFNIIAVAIFLSMFRSIRRVLLKS